MTSKYTQKMQKKRSVSSPSYRLCDKMIYSTQRRPRGMSRYDKVMTAFNLKREVHDKVTWTPKIVKIRNNPKTASAIFLFVILVLFYVMRPEDQSEIVTIPFEPNDQTTKPPNDETTKRPNDQTEFEQCDHLYFDLGSNIGVQIRKLYEPEKYPSGSVQSVLPYYDEFFGPAESRRESVCAFGFESNDGHEERLKEIESCYQRQGWNVEFHLKGAWPNDDGFINQVDPSNGYENWGAGCCD